MSPDRHPDRDEGLLDETAPLPDEGGETTVPSEGGDDDFGPAGEPGTPGPDTVADD